MYYIAKHFNFLRCVDHVTDYLLKVGRKLSMEQHAYIKFCYKLGKSATETFQMIKTVYGSEALVLNPEERV